MANKTINNKQRLGACNLILHIHVVVNQQLSKQGIADQFHMIASRAQVSTHRGCVFFLSYPLFIWSQAEFQVDIFAKVTSLLFGVNSQFINVSELYMYQVKYKMKSNLPFLII